MAGAAQSGHPAVTDDPRWQRIVARDRGADGAFWYSVASTGVFCRPSCPARTADPRHVRLHDTLEQARASGCRPCRRCHPEGMSTQQRNVELVARACAAIAASEHALPLAALAAQAGRSPSHFHRLFKAVTGISPKAYHAACRAERLRRALPGAASVTRTLYEAGFGSSSRFYATAPAALGMAPRRYRAGGADETIRFAVGATSLGALLVASSAAGVVAILLGDDPDALLRDLQDRFPRATLVGADADYEQLVARVAGMVERPALCCDLPLDVRGTAFQRRVWEALRAIGPGTTVSYAELARICGVPGRLGDVAAACAANVHAVAIPCHRVVRGDGGAWGYAWGIERKAALLRRESER
ncbi:bifunctional DNA-binding transcriptional regulator/O6-methylguanine-DNA methyltransferase Ada [uncultured Massilia sp.]|uniref:bifunctional DNA-binding transcriptional regulator/O6-methylguanine-DNA methyltransferase Ada n=1 Tax=uncultured Massilia sp. TaxID=169973 RepID=UPI0025E538FA|nr:bifunctional DNA-binding transcriptional regulator/O6-methylguanine-DNA methyltransferase Ada [uncultured Massilia sp.]